VVFSYTTYKLIFESYLSYIPTHNAMTDSKTMKEVSHTHPNNTDTVQSLFVRGVQKEDSKSKR
jgi:hypothetical protein